VEHRNNTAQSGASSLIPPVRGMEENLRPFDARVNAREACALGRHALD